MPEEDEFRRDRVEELLEQQNELLAGLLAVLSSPIIVNVSTNAGPAVTMHLTAGEPQPNQ